MGGLTQLRPGDIFAQDFRVVKPLREGGMGAVYVAEQLSTTKLRALKLMQPELVTQPALRKRFDLEAKIGAQIESDHVVEVISSGVDDATGCPWLAMELLEGEDLDSHVRHNGPLPIPSVAEIFDQAAHALSRAHDQQIVHRDLKPENIFLAKARRRGAEFVVKILDFGIARMVAEVKTTSSKTRTGLGTPLWMAPEQAEPGRHIVPQTDVWALGLIAFWALTGRYFWKTAYEQSATLMMLAMEAFVRPLPTASARAAEYGCKERIPPGFDLWFGRCVARDQKDRYVNAASAWAALEIVLDASKRLLDASATEKLPLGSISSASVAEARTHGPDPRQYDDTSSTAMIGDALSFPEIFARERSIQASHHEQALLVMEVLLTAMLQQRYPEILIEKVKVIYAELTRNAFEHGCVDASEVVTIQIEVTRVYVTISIFNPPGRVFDLASKLQEQEQLLRSEPRRRRGRGLLFARQHASCLEQLRSDKGCAIRAILYRSGHKNKLAAHQFDGFVVVRLEIFDSLVTGFGLWGEVDEIREQFREGRLGGDMVFHWRGRLIPSQNLYVLMDLVDVWTEAGRKVVFAVSAGVYDTFLNYIEILIQGDPVGVTYKSFDAAVRAIAAQDVADMTLERYKELYPGT
ncbi:serine/threonine-protein kinase [Sorangium sp. So ce375]|uniref:serine/threonine protein kinase n=1 Tax=Sorangium sp. So ce375 TaxID=3133306 RepID=UPI003F5CB8F7